ncbi:hypothetical protein P3G55_25935, partial [Leptospira sp. 96542]|nr:hypothetical protein [Leptospira sp. 96542]
MEIPVPAPATPSSPDASAPPAPRNIGFVLTRLRLVSGLTMFTFVVTHLLNHALGLVSPEAMAAGQRWFFAVWHSLPGATLLAAAALTHLSLVLYKQIVRPTLRMPHKTPEGPSERKASPGVTAPTPTAPAALSPAPPASTGARSKP